jgi:hypothetical protein
MPRQTFNAAYAQPLALSGIHSPPRAGSAAVTAAAAGLASDPLGCDDTGPVTAAAAAASSSAAVAASLATS